MTAFFFAPLAVALMPSGSSLLSEAAVDAGGNIMVPNAFVDNGIQEAANLAAHQPSDAEVKLYSDLRKSTVRFQSLIKQNDVLKPWQRNPAGTGLFVGSGWVLENGEDGPLLVTNSHVINDAIDVKVGVPAFSQQQFQARVVLNCPQFDIAFVKLADKDEEMKLNTLMGGKLEAVDLYEGMPPLGAEVIALGYPLGQTTPKLSKGVISGHEVVGDYTALQQTAPISPGSSGGPLYLAGTKKVVGINYASAAAENSQTNNYAIQMEKVRILKKRFDATLHKPAASFAEGERPQYSAADCMVDRTKCEYKVPKLTANAAPSTPELSEKYGCEQGGIFLNKVDNTSMLGMAHPPIDDHTFIMGVNGKKIDDFGMAPSDAGFGDPVGLTDLLFSDSSASTELMGSITTCDCGKAVEHKVPLTYFQNTEKAEMMPNLDEADIAPVDFEQFGSITVQQLTIPVAKEIIGRGRMDLMRFVTDPPKEMQLIVTDIDVTDEAVASVRPGDIVSTVNGKKVNTLADYRAAFQPSGERNSCQKDGPSHWELQTTAGGEAIQDFDGALKRQFEKARSEGYPISKAVKEAGKDRHEMPESLMSKSDEYEGLEPQAVEMRTDIYRGGAYLKIRTMSNGIQL